jgi:hypothetical protein
LLEKNQADTGFVVTEKPVNVDNNPVNVDNNRVNVDNNALKEEKRKEEKRVDARATQEEITKILPFAVIDTTPHRDFKTYEKVAACFRKSSWLRKNIKHLSKIDKKIKDILSGYYDDYDYKTPKKETAGEFKAKGVNDLMSELTHDDL